jgi:hypothetical protein
MSVYEQEVTATDARTRILARNIAGDESVIDFVKLVDLLQDKTYIQEPNNTNATSMSDNRGGRIEF